MKLVMLSAEAERLWQLRVEAACVSHEFGAYRGAAPTIGSRKARRIARAAAAVSPASLLGCQGSAPLSQVPAA